MQNQNHGQKFSDVIVPMTTASKLLYRYGVVVVVLLHIKGFEDAVNPMSTYLVTWEIGRELILWRFAVNSRIMLALL